MEISELNIEVQQGLVSQTEIKGNDIGCMTYLETMADTRSATTPFNGTVTKGMPWLDFNPKSGSVTMVDLTITITVDTTTLSPGTFVGEITYTGSFSPVILTINLTVTDPVFCSAGFSPEAINVTLGPREMQEIGFEILCGPPNATGELNWTATVKLLNESAGDWFNISPEMGTATANPDNPSLVMGTVDATKLPGAGTYQAEIAVTSNPTVIVPVTVVVRPPGPRLSVSQNAVLFQSVSSGPFTISETVTITNEGDGTLNWSLSGLPTWLTASTESGSVVSGPAGEDVVLTADPSSFGSGINTALLTVSASGASNNPQVVAVVLLTVPGATPATAEVSPNALVFVAEVGQPLPPKKTVSVSNVGGGTLAFNFSATISSPPGGSWLTLAGPGGAAPGQVTVLVNPSGLPLGVYRATLAGTFGGGAQRDVEVVLFVVAPGTALRALARGLPGAAQCGPTGLEVLATTIGNGLSLPVSFPRVLTALVVDDCGSGVDNATLVATVEGLNIPLRSLGTGFYSGTWVPQSAAAAVTLTFDALHPTFAKVQRSFTVATATAPGDVSLPTLFADGVVERAGFTSRRPLVPGGIISLFGARFAGENNFASELPLERELAGVSVRIGGEDAPLYFVGTTPNFDQINAQVPFEVSPGDSVPVAVSVGGLLTAPQNYLIAPAQPGLFDIGGGQGAVLIANTAIVVAPVGSIPGRQARPAESGEFLSIFCTGLGATSPTVESGAIGAGEAVTTPVTATIGGVNASVSFAGLAPNFVGLYQVNAVVPGGVVPGPAVPVVITQNGIVSNTVTVAVE